MHKEVYYGADARNKLFQGIAKVANAVKVTLGANGRNVVLGKPTVSPHITKDGVTVARSIFLQDFGENVGANLVREVAGKTVELAGDGTTTATVLTLSMVSRAKELIEKGRNPVKMKKGLDRAMQVVIEEIKALSQPITTFEELRNVASVSCNNDEELGSLIATAFNEIGRDGIVNVDLSKTHETSIDYSKGYKLTQGYINSLFADSSKVKLVKPYVFLIHGRITNVEEIHGILETLSKARGQVLIVCDGVDDLTLEALLRNRGVLNSCVVKPSGYGEDKVSSLRDIQAIVGGQIYGQNMTPLEKADVKHLGRADMIHITGTSTEIIGGKCDPNHTRTYIEKLTAQMNEQENEFEKDRLKARLGNLSSNVATIRIGGYTMTEIMEKRDRIDDAIHAVRSALDEGYCYGGGTTYVISGGVLVNLIRQEKDEDVQEGMRLMLTALGSPLSQLLLNGGIDSKNIMSHIGNLQYGNGIDVRTGELVDFAQVGIVDPTKVLRVALESATSVAGMFMTTECLVTDEE